MKIESLKINKLLHLGKPEHQFWDNYIQKYDFNNNDVSDLILVLLDKGLHNSHNGTNEVWAPLHAWRVLGQLKSEQAIPSLIKCFDFLYDDDWALNEFHKVFAMIGPAAIPALDVYFQKEADDEFSRVMAMDALCEIALIHSAHRDQVIEIYQNYMQAPEETAYDLNGLLMGRLVALSAKEAIEDIRKLFSLRCVDESCVGDLEDVEMELGLRTERTTPKSNYAFCRESDDSLEGIADEEFGFDAGMRYAVNEPFVRDAPKIGRNDPCYCGSHKKYKKCCGMS